ncbi:MAG: AraC family transcriptional regulator [Verrucomicrobia bacterium]|nr:AraC family transcriptional regulator [Verrucomicrobiota bacterium]
MKNETVRDHQIRLTRVMAYINGHLSEKLSLDILAGVACFSPYHFHRLFQAYIGVNLNVSLLFLGQAFAKPRDETQRKMDLVVPRAP